MYHVSSEVSTCGENQVCTFGCPSHIVISSADYGNPDAGCHMDITSRINCNGNYCEYDCSLEDPCENIVKRCYIYYTCNQACNPGYDSSNSCATCGMLSLSLLLLLLLLLLTSLLP